MGFKNLDTDFTPVVNFGTSEAVNYKIDYKNGKIVFETAPAGEVSVKVQGTEIVDAVYTKDGIILNVESPKYLEMLTGHEVSHSLEKLKETDNLFKAVKAFAEAKGEWESRLADKKARYEGVENADPEREVVADLIGEYLFQGSDFIMDLSVNHRNVFQKIYDEIKYLCKVVTAGSKEARRLEAVKHEFEKAYREGAQKNTAESGAKYSLYYKPNFTKAEWAVVNRKKHTEFDNPKFDLDTDKKWMYVNEKGSTVFAVYSKHDVDDSTVLYGSHGKQAERDFAKISQFSEGGSNHANRGRTTLDRLLADIKRKKGNRSNGVSYSERGISADRDVQLPLGESGSNGQGDYGNGTQDRWGSKLTEYNNEASDSSGASSFVTFSNDYQTIRNFMKDDSADSKKDVKYSLGYHAGDLGKAEIYNMMNTSTIANALYYEIIFSLHLKCKRKI